MLYAPNNASRDKALSKVTSVFLFDTLIANSVTVSLTLKRIADLNSTSKSTPNAISINHLYKEINYR